jgi:uncharacterized protein
MSTTSICVRPDAGCGVEVERGGRVRVVAPDGGQVGDVFAYSGDDPTEFLSASHTRAWTSRLFPKVGEEFVTTYRRPILRLVGDSSPGVHDMLIAACDPRRYELLGAAVHPSCAENLRIGLRSVGREPGGVVPQPVNLFMATPVGPDGEISWLPSPSRPGDRVEFEALMDLVFVLSACPQDLVPINGSAGPTPLVLEVT